jgi:DNA repair exonuclease SbcCD ATPase subunit
MPENNTSEILLARLAEGLDSTAKMTQALLSDLRESEADFAAMKAELNILKENVKGLSELVRDGGTSSILTRVALIEQNIENIKKWMDNHVDVHQKMKKDFTEIRDRLSQIEGRLANIEQTLREIEEESQEREREQRDSIVREIDLAHEKKKTDEKLRAERQSAIVKIVATVIISVLGLVGGYLVKSCTDAATSAEPPTRIVTPASSGPAQSP